MDATFIGVAVVVLVVIAFAHLVFSIRSKGKAENTSVEYVVKKEPTKDAEPKFKLGDRVSLIINARRAQVVEIESVGRHEYLTPNERHWYVTGHIYRVRIEEPNGDIGSIRLYEFELE